MANYRMNKIAIGSNTYECAEWYGVCSTSAGTQAKTVGIKGFYSAQLVEGCRVVVAFTQEQAYNGTPTLNINSTGARSIMTHNITPAGYREWRAGQIIAFVLYQGYWVIEDGGHADTAFYGKAKLSNTIADDATMALTPKAVYDAGYATTSQIPTKVSDLNNDSGFLTLSTLPVWDGSVT